MALIPMPTSNYNWVCFDCRTVTRQTKYSNRIPRCVSCGDDCFCLGDKVGVPRKEVAKSWAALREDCRSRMLAAQDRLLRWNVRRKHELERTIAQLEAMTENKDRARRIARLKEELAKRRGAAHV